MSFIEPLSSTDESQGTITYNIEKSEIGTIPGLFAFSFYIRDPVLGEKTHKESPLYIQGLLEYLKLTQKNEFRGWRVLVYIDQFTYDQLDKFPEFWNQKDSFLFGIISWPNYQLRNERPQILGLLLRTVRFRAPFDFKNSVIFIRDADTLFAEKLGKTTNLNSFTDFLYNWERAFLSVLESLQTQMSVHPLVLATGRHGIPKEGVLPLYHSEGISNEITGKKTRFGVFGGFLNTVPGTPVFQTLDVWNHFLEYLKKRTIRSLRPTNKGHYVFLNGRIPQRITRDTQFLMFFLMPAALDNLVFFEVKESLPQLDMAFTSRVKEIYQEMVRDNFTSSEPVYLNGGKSKRMRSKIEKRKTRKHSQPNNVSRNLSRLASRRTK